MSRIVIINQSSFGFKLGRAVGWTGAQAVRRSVQVAEATGDFGHNVVAGASQQYDDTNKSLAAKRAAYYAELAGVELAPKAEPVAKAVKAAKAAA
jgi:hypothetical protein